MFTVGDEEDANPVILLDSSYVPGYLNVNSLEKMCLNLHLLNVTEKQIYSCSNIIVVINVQLK
jgi:hypothetical protein